MGKAGQKIEELQEILTGEQYKKLEHMLDVDAKTNHKENQAIYAEDVRFGIEPGIEIYEMDENVRR